MIIQIDPKERFDIISFPGIQERFRREDPPARDEHIYEPIVYHCTDCVYNVEFSIDNFGKHFHLPFSNLTADDQVLFDEFSRTRGIYSKSFLDFYCPQCRKAVRVIYEGGVAGKGEFFVDLAAVLEKNITPGTPAQDKR